MKDSESGNRRLGFRFRADNGRFWALSLRARWRHEYETSCYRGRVESHSEKSDRWILDQRVKAEAYCSTANLGAGFNVFGLALSKYAEARPLLERDYHQIRERLEPLWNRKVVPIVTGFVASTVDGSITTLGRGESDYTAALLGAALATEQIWIWTDVNGLRVTAQRQ